MINEKELENILDELEKQIFSAEVYNDDFDGTSIGNLICLGNVREVLENHLDDDAENEAIKELQKYREIGTVEECREAVEKQTPKKPVKDKYNHNCCPNCGWIVSGEGGYGEEFCPHCENCGQAIRWENLEGMEDE